jgi:glycosyltransferase involved in cell wall biosynthesis
MHLVFLSDNMKFSGGRKVHFEYASFLREQGHDVEVLVQKKEGELADFLEVTVVEDFSTDNIPECDLIVGTKPLEVLDAWNSKKGKVVHFCQGFEITDLEQRLKGQVLPERYRGKGIFNNLKLKKKKKDWLKKIEKFDQIYNLPTHLVTVAKPLQQVLEKRYARPVKLCLNGVHDEFFFPAEIYIPPAKNKPVRIINIGPAEVTFKGIQTTLETIKILKEHGRNIEFIRVSPNFSEAEKQNPLVDEFHEHLSQEKLGELIRSCDIYISNSTDGEGFGLPALEALSCGVIAVLSNISSYRNFSDSENFCFFVREHSPESTVDAVEFILENNPENLLITRENALKVASEYSFIKACNRFEEILVEINSSK